MYVTFSDRVLQRECFYRCTAKSFVELCQKKIPVFFRTPDSKKTAGPVKIFRPDWNRSKSRPARKKSKNRRKVGIKEEKTRTLWTEKSIFGRIAKKNTVVIRSDIQTLFDCIFDWVHLPQILSPVISFMII